MVYLCIKLIKVTRYQLAELTSANMATPRGVHLVLPGTPLDVTPRAPTPGLPTNHRLVYVFGTFVNIGIIFVFIE
jgi:hypothetical protein